MADRPIIFSAPMVRALLDGRKTQTRRILKPPAPFVETDSGLDILVATGDLPLRFTVGDRLWVRENIALPRNWVKYGPVYYAADKHFFMNQTFDVERLRPSIHMPRWASRLTLIVSGVKVERLQDISDEDAESEGMVRRQDGWFAVVDEKRGLTGAAPDARAAFGLLWNMINGPEAWDANPWVAALSFTVHRRNIDTLDKAA